MKDPIEYRDAFIDSCISLIIKEHKGESDVVDNMCKAKELVDGRKHCLACGEKTPELKKCSCPDCGGKLVKEMLQFTDVLSKRETINTYKAFGGYPSSVRNFL